MSRFKLNNMLFSYWLFLSWFYLDEVSRKKRLFRACTCQGVRNVRFSENLTCFVFLKHPFWDSPFCLITDDLMCCKSFHTFRVEWLDCACTTKKMWRCDDVKKMCSENIQQIYKRTPMPKCDFNKVAKQLHWNHTLAWELPCKFIECFQNTFF